MRPKGRANDRLDRQEICSKTMSDKLQTLLAERPWLLADGAIGTNLFARGLPPGIAPERWNIEHAERVSELHSAFLAAGADIILTNSFGANRRRLELLDEHDVTGLNAAAVHNARRARDEVNPAAVVAGSIGPSGALLQPYGDLSRAAAQDLFTEQANALAEAGAECLWIETMAASEELQAAVQGAATTGLPLVCTFSFDSGSHTMMGLDPEAAIETLLGLPVKPLAVGANCGCGAADTVSIVHAFRQRLGTFLPIIAKANCGQPVFRGGEFQYGRSPAHMACYAALARSAGARIIGGCCGTGPRHLQAMRQVLETQSPEPFDPDRIEELLEIAEGVVC